MNASRRSFLQTAIAGSLAAAAGAASAQDKTDPEFADVKPADKKLKMLILGGTGFLGPHTVRYAVARGHTMTLFNRGRSQPDLFPDLEKLRGDREENDLEALKGREFDVIIDTSAYVPWHVEATAKMFADSAKQYVIFSSVSAYADHGQVADVDSPLAECTDEFAAECKTIRESLANYGAMKARCEKTAEAAMPGRVTVIRPGLIVGPGDYSDRFVYWAVRAADGGEVLAPGDGKDPVQWVDARDLAKWTLHCIEKNITGVFNGICPGGMFTMAEMVHGMKAAVWTDAQFTWVGEDFLEANEVQAWGHLPVWMPRSEPEVAAFHLVDTDKSVEAGLTFRPLAETARDTVTWHREKRPADYEWGARGTGIPRSRETELLKKWHERQKEQKPAGAKEPATESQ